MSGAPTPAATAPARPGTTSAPDGETPSGRPTAATGVDDLGRGIANAGALAAPRRLSTPPADQSSASDESPPLRLAELSVASRDWRRSTSASSWLSQRTRSIRAAKPLLARLMHRQSVGALTGRAAFPSHGLRSRDRLWLSHKSRALEESPTTMADATPTPTAACRINVAGAPVVGQIDNERPSSPTYATATPASNSELDAGGAIALREAQERERAARGACPSSNSAVSCGLSQVPVFLTKRQPAAPPSASAPCFCDHCVRDSLSRPGIPLAREPTIAQRANSSRRRARIVSCSVSPRSSSARSSVADPLTVPTSHRSRFVTDPPTGGRGTGAPGRSRPAAGRGRMPPAPLPGGPGGAAARPESNAGNGNRRA